MSEETCFGLSDPDQHRIAELNYERGYQVGLASRDTEIEQYESLRKLQLDLIKARDAEIYKQITQNNALEENLRVAREALKKARQFCTWLSVDSLKYPGTDAGMAGKHEGQDIDKALAKLAQADGGEDEMKLNRAWAMPNHNTCEIGPIKPREFWVDPDISDFLPILDTNVHYAFSDRRNPRDIHVHEVLPETPSKDAETATEEYADKLWNKILREGKGVHAKTLIKYGIVEGQSMGESRAMKVIEKINYEYDQNIKNAIVDAERSRTREICEFLRSDKYKADVYADEIEKRFLK